MRSTIVSGLRGRGTQVAVAALVAALGLTASGAAASKGTADAQAPVHSSPSSAPASGNATIERASLDSAAAASAQPPVDQAAYDACANIDFTHPQSLVGPTTASAAVAGWADAGKLGGSVPIGYPAAGVAKSQGSSQGYSDAPGIVGTDGATYECFELLAQLNYDGQREFPPVTATFLAYGSIPVTATAYFVQDGPAPLKAAAYQQVSNSAGVIDLSTTYSTIVTTSQVLLRVSQVKVNGVSLDVGSHCQTTGPVYTPDPVLDPGDNTLVVTGGNAPGEPEPRQQQLASGGAQAGLATVPPFAGCVTPSGENLDALLDSALSGPGNYVRVDQGPLCSPVVASGFAGNCTTSTTNNQTTINNQPLDTPLWTVSHGGAYSATAPLTFSQNPRIFPNVFTCTGSAVSGRISNSAGPPRSPIGTFRWTGTSDCSEAGGPGGVIKTSPWTITQEGTATLDVSSYDAATHTTNGTIDDLTLDVQGPGGCTAQLTGALPMTYSNDTGLLAPNTVSANPVAGGAVLEVDSSTCSQLKALGSSTYNTPTLSASYALGLGAVITSP